MAIQCPKCGKRHTVTEFRGGDPLRCPCGFVLEISMLNTVEDFLRYFASEEERKKANVIQQEAQTVCRMILDDSFPDVDIEIAMNNLKEKVRKLFPDKMQTYRMIYEARFQRLWAQFRNPESR